MKKLSLILSLVAYSFTTPAQSVNVKPVAANGYDVVAYITQSKAVEGSSKFELKHEEAFYQFSSKKNLEMFKSNPGKYLPQYGGFCAMGVAGSNGKYPTDPNTFKVTDGKLYLFYNGPYQGKDFNGRDPWVKDEKVLITKGNTNWESLKKN